MFYVSKFKGPLVDIKSFLSKTGCQPLVIVQISRIKSVDRVVFSCSRSPLKRFRRGHRRLQMCSGNLPLVRNIPFKLKRFTVTIFNDVE